MSQAGDQRLRQPELQPLLFRLLLPSPIPTKPSLSARACPGCFFLPVACAFYEFHVSRACRAHHSSMPLSLVLATSASFRLKFKLVCLTRPVTAPNRTAAIARPQPVFHMLSISLVWLQCLALRPTIACGTWRSSGAVPSFCCIDPHATCLLYRAYLIPGAHQRLRHVLDHLVAFPSVRHLSSIILRAYAPNYLITLPARSPC